jgi:hypothetical protein
VLRGPEQKQQVRYMAIEDFDPVMQTRQSMFDLTGQDPGPRW